MWIHDCETVINHTQILTEKQTPKIHLLYSFLNIGGYKKENEKDPKQENH